MDKIKIVGAREHNLKNINLEIPRDKLVVITGLSGSGKSSLAFDTIYAEGQRRYVESLSSYARQFLGVMQKPDVDYIEGLSPAISIDQKSASRNPRSTVGTITEIYDYLRLLFARAGVAHCPSCGKPVERQSATEIANQIIKSAKGTKRIAILSPQISDRKGEHKQIFERIEKAGFVRARVDKIIMDLDEAKNLELDKQKKHSIEVVVDRLILESGNIDESSRKRLFDSVEKALDFGDGQIIVYDFETKKDLFYSENFACAKCGISLPEIAPRSFSFNSPHGACKNCQGLGFKKEIDPKLVLPNPRLSISEGAIRPWVRNTATAPWYFSVLKAAATKNGVDVDRPIGKLTKDQLKVILYGTGEQVYHVRNYPTTYEGVIPNLTRRYKQTDSDYVRREIEKYMVERICPICNGARLRPEVLGVKIADKNIVELSGLTIDKTKEFFEKLPKNLTPSQNEIAKQIVKEILDRLTFLLDVGLSYLTIDRNAATLAGGEAQRIRLATQIGSGLMGVLYILDEPSIGLHQHDNGKLLKTLMRLRDLGNSVIVVEHDEETMRKADYLIDIGPGAGEHGGKVICQGVPAEVMKSDCSVTADYLAGRKKIATPKVRRIGTGNFLKVISASEHNLKSINAKFPLGTFICVTGLSGSGKSTLVNDILAKSLAQKYHRAEALPGEHKEILGVENLNKIIDIDQSPIGKSPRSNPATYTGTFTPIRELFASTAEAKMRGYKAGRFSFNVKGGRCERCRGDGVLKIEMHFLPDVYITCEECKGARYNKEALDIHYRDKSIADVLDMTVEQAAGFFKNIPAIYQKLSVLEQVGLGYIKLGQPATTLSGGEAQRIKLASELSRRGTGMTIYILDEPTTGLHFEDVKKLLGVLNSLVDRGNTVLVIEHNLDVIKSADHIIDMGPKGGDKGGEIIATGTPEEVAKVAGSYTGQYLKKALK
ncbi:excinuclease ABC subunit A [Candidatus Berkelbacteria bacterium RIFOXYA2_FULL_43_10]|uniref:UvrABC system protein A n=1 Tax=Candidatus Berkelbacteria bacterium RIFOXYA2_FULL_43_10 TaxID=1797472 RepID=A0A1F5ED44_9BACT|nr:MAG: excinuclease ABC subunit A [Candidatus Berkelbacteria bacterium RIFOXYA2_FULL_43_10]